MIYIAILDHGAGLPPNWVDPEGREVAIAIKDVQNVREACVKLAAYAHAKWPKHYSDDVQAFLDDVEEGNITMYGHFEEVVEL